MMVGINAFGTYVITLALSLRTLDASLARSPNNGTDFSS
jgi:hypothetical protein